MDTGTNQSNVFNKGINAIMRYKYTITKEGGETEEMEAMSWKKLFKSLLLKYPEFSGWCTYINKKGHVQVRNFNKGRETKKL